MGSQEHSMVVENQCDLKIQGFLYVQNEWREARRVKIFRKAGIKRGKKIKKMI